MGLDISAYKNIQPIDCLFDTDGEPVNPQTREPIEGDWRKFHSNCNFPDSATDIDFTKVYRASESMGFRAGSYGGYNQWREELAKLGGWPEIEIEKFGAPFKSCAASAWNATSGLFLELINFSDFEGTLGTAVSKKLLEDFRANEEKAKAIGGYFYGKYQEWTKAFEMAADNGAIYFH